MIIDTDDDIDWMLTYKLGYYFYNLELEVCDFFKNLRVGHPDLLDKFLVCVILLVLFLVCHSVQARHQVSLPVQVVPVVRGGHNAVQQLQIVCASLGSK